MAREPGVDVPDDMQPFNAVDPEWLARNQKINGTKPAKKGSGSEVIGAS